MFAAGCRYESHFTDGERRVQRGQLTLPVSRNVSVTELGWEPMGTYHPPPSSSTSSPHCGKSCSRDPPLVWAWAPWVSDSSMPRPLPVPREWGKVSSHISRAMGPWAFGRRAQRSHGASPAGVEKYHVPRQGWASTRGPLAAGTSLSREDPRGVTEKLRERLSGACPQSNRL